MRRRYFHCLTISIERVGQRGRLCPPAAPIFLFISFLFTFSFVWFVFTFTFFFPLHFYFHFFCSHFHFFERVGQRGRLCSRAARHWLLPRHLWKPPSISHVLHSTGMVFTQHFLRIGLSSCKCRQNCVISLLYRLRLIPQQPLWHRYFRHKSSQCTIWHNFLHTW